MNAEAEEYDAAHDIKPKTMTETEIESVENSTEKLMTHIAASRAKKKEEKIDSRAVVNSGFEEHKQSMKQLLIGTGVGLRELMKNFKILPDGNMPNIGAVFDAMFIDIFDKAALFRRELSKIEFLQSIGLRFANIDKFKDGMNSLAVMLETLGNDIDKLARPLNEMISNGLSRNVKKFLNDHFESYRTKCIKVMDAMKKVRDMLFAP